MQLAGRSPLTGTLPNISTLVSLLVLPLLAFFVSLGSVPLFDLDEGAFSAATWEMLQRGDFVTTYLNGEPRFDKPILIYWCQALSVSVFGVNEWAFRLPSAVAATAWMLAIYRFATERFTPQQSLLAFWMASTSILIVVIGRAATADALLNLFIALALFNIYRYYEQPRPPLVLATFTWIALGFLTKGPVALVLPLGVILLFSMWQRRWRWIVPALRSPLAWLILFAIILPWYLLEYRDQGQAFIDGFFLKHNVGRFSTTMESHGGSLMYYLPVIGLIMLPYTGAFLQAVPAFLKSLKTDTLSRFLLCWFALVFVLFSFSSTQLPHYLLYGATPLFLVAARHFPKQLNRPLAFGLQLCVALIMLALPWFLTTAASEVKGLYEQALLGYAQQQLTLVYLVFAALLCLTLVSGLFLPHSFSQAWLLGTGVAFASFFIMQLLPLVANTQQLPVKKAAEASKSLSQPLVMAGVNMPSITVYRQQLVEKRAAKPGDWVFTRKGSDDWQEADQVLFDEGGLAIIQRGERR